MREMEFNLDRQQVRVTLKKGDGTDRVVLINEIDTKERDEYVKFMSAKMTLGPDGRPAGFKSLDGLQLKLLSLALTDEAGKKIPEKDIGSWPPKVVDQMFKVAQEMSALDQAGADAAGNA